MARRTTPPPPRLVSKTFTAQEIDVAVRKLRRRIEDVKNLESAQVDHKDPKVDVVESDIRNAVREVFGAESPEYDEHQYHRIWRGPMIAFGDDYAAPAKFKAGIQQSLVTLEGLVSRLEEKRADLGETAPVPTSSTVNSSPPPSAPSQITDSLGRLRVDHPDERKVAFIMMKFGTTPAHAAILKAIRGVLKERGISGLRADERQYHDDLFPNIMTYMHGCAFGIAVFERLEANDFNPNVSLEVGYMMASRKAVCLLKDRTLRTLHTDLVGKIYRTFDPQTAAETIPEQLRQWMDDRGIV